MASRKQRRALANLFLLPSLTFLTLWELILLASPVTAGPIISNLAITNVRDTTFTVSWITSVPATGTINYGTNSSLGTIIDDVRGAGSASTTHYVTLLGLDPNITYYFDVISGDIVDNNGGSHYSVTTGPTIGLPTPDSVYGRVYKSDGTTSASGSIVYFNIVDNNGLDSPGQSAPLSALVDGSGYWFYNLGNARTADLGAYFLYTVSGGDNLQLAAQGGSDGNSAQLIVDTTNCRPALNLVLKASSSTTITPSVNPSVFGQTVTFTATVTSGAGTPTGTVTFKDGTVGIGTSPVSGGTATLTTSTLALGSHSIIALYSGDSHFESSTSNSLTQIVERIVMLAPSGTVNNWDDVFRFRGRTDATWYYLDVEKADGTVVLEQWYQAALACSGVNCTIIPSELQGLSNGNYRWRLFDWSESFGAGPWTSYLHFTLTDPCYALQLLVSPNSSGAIQASPGPNCGTKYQPGTVVTLTATLSNRHYVFDHWSGDLSGSPNPTSLPLNVSKSITANFLAVPALLSPIGTVTDWDGTFRWTGVSDASWYYLDIEQASGTVLLEDWFPASSLCSGVNCVFQPTSLQGLPNANYRWRLFDWDAAYGAGPWTPYTNFTLNDPCFKLLTSVSPSGSGSIQASPAPNCGTSKYQPGTVVTLTAAPSDRHFLFHQWSGAVTDTTNPITLTLTAHASITATFAAVPTLLSPSGTVSDWDGTFRWTGLADAIWYSVEVAKADGTQLLQQWYPAASLCTGTTCVLAPPELQTLPNGDYRWQVYDWGEAYGSGPGSPVHSFRLDQPCVTLLTSVSPSGKGTLSVTPPPNCGTTKYQPNTVVTLTATANLRYRFDHWSENASGTTNPVTVTMTAPKRVVANFTMPPVALGAPSGTVTDWDGSFRWTGWPEATWYYVTIEKADGTALLESWYSAASLCSGVSCIFQPPTLQGLSNGDYRWRLYDWDATYGSGPWTAYANFTLSQTCFGLATAVNPSGRGTLSVTPAPNCGTKYASGTVVTLTATANLRYRFDHWSGDASGTINPVPLTMTAPKSVTAHLLAPPVTLASPSGTVTDWDGAFRWTGWPDATWYYLDIETADGTLLLERWYQAPAVCSGTSCVLTPPELQSLLNGAYRWRVYDWDAAYGSGPWTAYTNFTLSQTCFNLTTAMNPSGKGTLSVNPAPNCGTRYQPGTVVTLIVSTNLRYRFDFWSGDASGTTNPVTLTVNGPKSVTANLTATPVTLTSPSGVVRNWDGSFRWTGLAEASWYNVEVEQADGTVLLQKWYPAASVCSGVSCVLVPSELQGLAAGDYRWRLYDWGDAYGDGPWTPYLSFTLSPLGMPVVDPLGTPRVTGTPTATSAVTATTTLTATWTATPVATPSQTRTPTVTRTGTGTLTATVTPTLTRTATYAATATPTRTATGTGSRRPTPTRTAVPTATPTSTRTVTPTLTTTRTPTPSQTPTATRTRTPTRTATATRTAAPVNMPTLTATYTPTKLNTPASTVSRTATVATTRIATATETRTCTPTATTKSQPPPATVSPTQTGTGIPKAQSPATVSRTTTLTSTPARATPSQTSTPPNTTEPTLVGMYQNPFYTVPIEIAHSTQKEKLPSHATNAMEK